MNTLSHPGSVSGSAALESPMDADGVPRDGQRKLAGAIRRPPTGIEARISSLKVLSLTLLAEIESLEKQARGDSPDDLDLHAEVRHFEAELIRSALIRTGGRQRRAARLLGMKVTTLNTKIRRYNIKVEACLAVKANGSE